MMWPSWWIGGCVRVDRGTDARQTPQGTPGCRRGMSCRATFLLYLGKSTLGCIIYISRKHVGLMSWQAWRWRQGARRRWPGPKGDDDRRSDAAQPKSSAIRASAPAVGRWTNKGFRLMRNDRSALHHRPPRQPERSCVPPRRAWGMGRGLCQCVVMPIGRNVVKSLYRCRCQSAYRRGCASPGGVQPIAQRRRGVDERSRGKAPPTAGSSLCRRLVKAV